nr:SDR family oxidoreductase [Bradyrhizobium manausense]
MLMMRSVVAAVENRFGQIDALINNAGISSDRCPVEEVTEEMLRRSIGVYLAANAGGHRGHEAARLRQHRQSLVDSSSCGLGRRRDLQRRKGCHHRAIQGWAREFARWNVRVNVVAPEHTETEMTARNVPPELRAAKAKAIPLGRYAQPREMSEAIAFLASDEASFITGQILSPNGGFVIT